MSDLTIGATVTYSVDRYGYKVDGIRLTRCTSVTGTLPKPWMGRWAANTVAAFAVDNWKDLAVMTKRGREDRLKKSPWEKRDDAARRGTVVHEAVEKFITGGSLSTEMTEDERACALSAMGFLADHGLGTPSAATEMTLVNLTHGIAGTVDLYDVNPAGESWMVDWKTSKSIYREHAVQQAIYQNCEYALVDKTSIGKDEWTARVERWEPASRMGLVHVTDKHCHLHEIRREEWDRLWTVARAALHTKRWLDDTNDYRKTPRVRVFDIHPTGEEEKE